MNTALMNRCMHITSLSSFRSTGHNIPVAVGFHRGSEMVAYPAAGLISKPVQTTTDGSCAEVLLYSLHDDKVTFGEPISRSKWLQERTAF